MSFAEEYADKLRYIASPSADRAMAALSHLTPRLFDDVKRLLQQNPSLSYDEINEYRAEAYQPYPIFDLVDADAFTSPTIVKNLLRGLGVITSWAFTQLYDKDIWVKILKSRFPNAASTQIADMINHINGPGGTTLYESAKSIIDVIYHGDPQDADRVGKFIAGIGEPRTGEVMRLGSLADTMHVESKLAIREGIRGANRQIDHGEYAGYLETGSPEDDGIWEFGGPDDDGALNTIAECGGFKRSFEAIATGGIVGASPGTRKKGKRILAALKWIMKHGMEGGAPSVVGEDDLDDEEEEDDEGMDD